MFRVFEYPSDEHERTSYGAQAICETCGARVESNNGDVKLHRSPGYAETSAINHWNTRANECDREEMLALAEEIDANGDALLADTSLLVGSVGLMRCYAERIRKALGVE